MKRDEFLKEMKTGFSDTLKGVLAPFIEEKAEQLDDAASILTGRQLFELPHIDTTSVWHMQDFFLGEKSFYLIGQKDQLYAFQKLCPTCNGMLTVTSFDKKCKCFICDQSLSLETFEGDLVVTPLEVVERQEKLFALV